MATGREDVEMGDTGAIGADTGTLEQELDEKYAS